MHNSAKVLNMEAIGIPYFEPLRSLIKYAPQHRGLTNAYLNGGLEFKENILAIRPQIAQALSDIDQINTSNNDPLKTAALTNNLKAQWTDISNNSFNMHASNAFSAHTTFISGVINIIELVSIQSKMDLDSSNDGHFIVDIMTKRLPWLIELTSQLRGTGAGAATRGAVSQDESIKLKILLDRLQQLNSTLDKSLALVYAENPALKDAYGAASDKAKSMVTDYIKTTNEKILNPSGTGITSKDYFALGTETIETALTLFNDMQFSIHALVSKRIDEHKFSQTVFIATILCSLALVLYLYIGMYINIKDNVDKVDEVAKRVAEGDLCTELHFDTEDEMKDIEADINTIVRNYNSVIQRFSSSVLTLSSAAEELEGTTKEVKTSIDTQLTETESVASAITQMSATVKEVAQATESASIAAQTADEASNKGRQVVNATISDINHVADEVEKIVEVMNGLDTQSNEIGSVVSVIKDIADKTNLLALNAAIEAARAGEQGRGFAVVADEVRMLANRTQESTQVIQTIIGRLQVDAKRAAVLMRQGQDKVKESVIQARSAGESLERITASVDKINQQNHQIASAAEQQSSVAEEVSRNVIRINDGTNQTAAAMRNVFEASMDLAKLANGLRALINDFKLRDQH